MKKIHDDEHPNWGCPNTEMRTQKDQFEAAHQGSGLSFHMKPDAPHYSNHHTRIAFSKWQDSNKIIQMPLNAETEARLKDRPEK